MRRQKSTFLETYHLINRGMTNINIFRNEDDKKKFISLVAIGAEKYKIKFFAYCLMDTHYHLCVRSINKEYKDISKFSQYINTQYVKYYNSTETENGEQRSGSIFRGPYKSVPVNSEFQLAIVIAYIHNNATPLKVNIEAYQYSSYYRYLNLLSGNTEGEKNEPIKLDMSYLTAYTTEELKTKTVESSKYQLCEGMQGYIGKNYLPDNLLADELEKKYVIKIMDIVNMEEKEQGKYLHEINKMTGTSIKQIGRILGMKCSQIRSLLKKYKWSTISAPVDDIKGPNDLLPDNIKAGKPYVSFNENKGIHHSESNEIKIIKSLTGIIFSKDEALRISKY